MSTFSYTNLHIIFYFLSFLLMLPLASKRKSWKEMKDKVKYNVDILKINLSCVNENTEKKSQHYKFFNWTESYKVQYVTLPLWFILSHR